MHISYQLATSSGLGGSCRPGAVITLPGWWRSLSDGPVLGVRPTSANGGEGFRRRPSSRAIRLAVDAVAAAKKLDLEQIPLDFRHSLRA